MECLFLLLIDVVWIPKNLRLIYFFFSYCRDIWIYSLRIVTFLLFTQIGLKFHHVDLHFNIPNYCTVRNKSSKEKFPVFSPFQRMFYLRANVAKKLVENTLYVRRDVKTRKQGFHVVHTFLVCASSLTDSHTLR